MTKLDYLFFETPCIYPCTYSYNSQQISKYMNIHTLPPNTLIKIIFLHFYKDDNFQLWYSRPSLSLSVKSTEVLSLTKYTHTKLDTHTKLNTRIQNSIHAYKTWYTHTKLDTRIQNSIHACKTQYTHTKLNTRIQNSIHACKTQTLK